MQVSPEWSERRSEWKIRKGDPRTPSDVDYSRVIHSASFRRLQGKTQVLGLGDGDFYRTRLTHSLEVAQIAGSIARMFEQRQADEAAALALPDRATIQAIGMTHDLGHPPFGHGGEVALNYCMRHNGGFEGNGQTLRILTKLEKFSERDGSDLARRTLLGVLKYPVGYQRAHSGHPDAQPRLRADVTTVKLLDREASKPPKCYMDSEREVVDWILEPLTDLDRDAFGAIRPAPTAGSKHHKSLHKSLDCSIMDVADDISFGVHDLEDGIALGLLRQEDLRTHVPEGVCGALLTYLNASHPGQYGNDVYDGWVSRLYAGGRERKHQIGRLVDFLIRACELTEVDGFAEPLLRYRARLPDGPRAFLDALAKANRETIIFSPTVQQMELRGQGMVIAVFEALQSEPEKFLPTDTRDLWRTADGDLRVICDHVAGMTDRHLEGWYKRLYSPGAGSVFDKV